MVNLPVGQRGVRRRKARLESSQEPHHTGSQAPRRSCSRPANNYGLDWRLLNSSPSRHPDSPEKRTSPLTRGSREQQPQPSLAAHPCHRPLRASRKPGEEHGRVPRRASRRPRSSARFIRDIARVTERPVTRQPNLRQADYCTHVHIYGTGHTYGMYHIDVQHYHIAPCI